MPDLGSNYPIKVERKETLQVKLKWAQAQEQELHSRIKALKQQIEDLLKKNIPSIEAEIIQLEDMFEQTKKHREVLEKDLAGNVHVQ